MQPFAVLNPQRQQGHFPNGRWGLNVSWSLPGTPLGGAPVFALGVPVALPRLLVAGLISDHWR
jgi:hypothetical protein